MRLRCTQFVACYTFSHAFQYLREGVSTENGSLKTVKEISDSSARTEARFGFGDIVGSGDAGISGRRFEYTRVSAGVATVARTSDS